MLLLNTFKITAVIKTFNRYGVIMKRLCGLIVLTLMLSACGAKDPYAYRTKDGPFRPVNEPSRYTEEQIKQARKDYNKRTYYNGPETKKSEAEKTEGMQ